MLRRSAHNSTPRKKYTIDAFEGIAELQEHTNDGADSRNESDDEFQTQLDQTPEGGAGDDTSDSDDSGSEARAPGDIDIDHIPPSGGSQHALPRRRRTNASSAPRSAHGHGAAEPHVSLSHASKPSRRRVCCGPSSADYEPLEKAIHKWGHAFPLPKREVDSNGCGGFAASFYDDGGRRDGRLDFHHSQPSLTLLNWDEYLAHIKARHFHGARFLMGPFRAPHLTRADPGQAVRLPGEKPGFVLNVGARPECLEWVPNRVSSDQYLTVSLAPLEPYVFQGLPQYKSVVQIWHVRASQDGRLAVSQAPTVQMVLCSEWGDAVCLTWSPFGAGDDALGLLGAIWTDGSLRVVKVPRSRDQEGPSYLGLSEPLAEYRAPNTVFTSMTWLSGHEIAASCANGFVAVFKLGTPVTTRPSVYRPVTDSYITKISSCAPSRPHLILVESLGRVTLSDISRPLNSGQLASSQRVRTGALQFCWNDHSQSVVTTDDVRGIHALPVRKISYLKAVGINKSVTTTIAGSPCHPHVLVGTVSGEAMCVNPLQKFLSGKRAIKQQKWFVHEWRPAGEQEAEPMSRFAEGHKADEIRLGPDENKLVRTDGEMGEAIVHEEGTAVTVLSWNPNLHVAGWAAAGLGSGLIRVEDIAV